MQLIESKIPATTRYILQVNISASLDEHHYRQEKTCFLHTSLHKARKLLRESEGIIDAIVVAPNDSFAAIDELRREAQHRAIPFILYSLKFDQNVKDMAMRLKADDYQCELTNLTPGHLGFMKKLLCFKNTYRGEVPEAKNKIRAEQPNRFFDVSVALLAILILSPVLLLIATAIKLGSRGPLFKKLPMVGFNYSIFELYEFRAEVESLSKKSNSWATSFNKFIVATGLNKLPELFNVLKGDICIVGSRPFNLNEAAKLTTDGTAAKLLEAPGLTGLWGIRIPDSDYQHSPAA